MIRRRNFLQFSASTLAACSFSNLDIIQGGNRYARVLTQNTNRKLALLVGVNNYPDTKRFVNLQGCVTDVRLQQELLIHRFGFKANDILTLTSDDVNQRKPTRSNILNAFEEHLIKQAKPGDVVVFHFSGHGSRILETDRTTQQCRNDEFNSTLVPGDDGEKNVAKDITGRTLFLLMSALNTENVTLVLDSCYSGGGTRGNFIIRSVSGDGLKISSEEISYQNKWMERLKISGEELAPRRCRGVAKGVAIAATQRDEEAADVPISDFHAGAFTYALTQYLWQQTDRVGNVIGDIAPIVKYQYGHRPLFDGEQNQPIYFINKLAPPADAVIIKREGEKATLWLGGLDEESLEGFINGATFTIVNDSVKTLGNVELVTRNGLIAEAKSIDKGIVLQPGMLLQETSRVIPTNLTLNIGLDPSLAGEVNIAKQELSKIPRIEVVASQLGNKPYSSQVHYILGRMTANYRQRLHRQGKITPDIGTIGLFTKGLEIVPDSFGHVKETVDKAANRLSSKLKSLLAIQIVKKTMNANSSGLNIRVTMSLVESPNKILASNYTAKYRNSSKSKQQIISAKLPLNKLFQMQVENNEEFPLYMTCLLVDSTGSLVVVFPYQSLITIESMQIAAKQTQIIGDPQQIKLQAIKQGTGEALFILSRKTLKNTAKTFASLTRELERDSGALPLDGSRERGVDEIIVDLLSDLRSERRATNVQGNKPINNADVATLSMTFEVG